MTDDNEILSNISALQQRIRIACEKSGRSAKEVQLLLATKTVPVDRVKIALRAGCTLIAENKIQELKEKYPELKSLPHVDHFIGHLQSNKIKELLRYDISCIQSIDRFELAEKLDHRLGSEGRAMDILIQVNTSNEPSKFGVSPDRTLELIRRIATLKNLRIKGLMTIGLLSGEPDKVRVCFRSLKEVQKQVITAGITGVFMNELSMGMSGDLEIAIEEGATIVRIGTAIFGTRPTPDRFYWNEGSEPLIELS